MIWMIARNTRTVVMMCYVDENRILTYVNIVHPGVFQPGHFMLDTGDFQILG